MHKNSVITEDVSASLRMLFVALWLRHPIYLEIKHYQDTARQTGDTFIHVYGWLAQSELLQFITHCYATVGYHLRIRISIN